VAVAIAPAPTEATTVAADVAPVIETRALTKRFGRVLALDGLDLEIPKTAVGLLGANGAGKTTLIRLLLGLSRPTSGSARVLGRDTVRQGVAIRERTGYMPESDALPSGVTAADFVAHMAEMSGLPSRAARQRAADVLFQVGLDEERYRLIGGFSTGMKQRVKLAQAIVHDPELIFLDEPTNGMDPRGRDEMLDLIARIDRQLGIAVVLSSHILGDIERVCRYVVILDGGRLVASQPLGAASAQAGQLLVRLDDDIEPFIARLEALGVEARPAGAAHGRDEIVVLQADDRAFDAIRDAAADLGLPLRSLTAQVRSLEDIYFGSVAGRDASGGERAG
jgi:ABC-2 type transport system ATP-binding protein